MRVCMSCRRLLPADRARCQTDGAASELVESLPPGTLIAKYRIERMLGEGGMGFVYEATQVDLDRRTAIKMLRPELAKHEQVATRFLNEARAVNMIAHQNIINVYDYGDSLAGAAYFVMEYLDGETLDELMHRRLALPVPLLLHLCTQIAKALGAAHAKQIVHRDLKPANIYIISRDENPCFIKLLDFGIAQLRGAGAVQGLTLTGAVLGTPQYMSPEQISGGLVDARSDVWAMGVIMYRAATGQAAFKGEEFVELADKILHHPPPPAHQVAAVPLELSRLIASCLERRAEDRCRSADELLAGLDRVKRELRLDDDAILAQISADAQLGKQIAPILPRTPTHEAVAGSLPEFHGADPHALQPSVERTRRSRLGWYIALGAVAGIAVAGYAVTHRDAPPTPKATVHDGRASDSVDRPPVAPPPVDPPPASPRGPSFKALFASGGAAAVRHQAELDLRETITSGRLQERGIAIDAIAASHSPAGAPLLYIALGGPPEIAPKAARALGELALPDAAPELRTAYGKVDQLIRNDVAAVLFRLGDKDARAGLVSMLGQPGVTRFTAATALAAGGDDAGRAVLGDFIASRPQGSDQWRRAAIGLVELGDPHAHALLESELSQTDPVRAVGAATALARAGDTRAKDQLGRMVGDAKLARSGAAAVALAELGDPRAVEWIDRGLASADADDRVHALAVCGLTAAAAASHAAAIAQIATDDQELRVRMTAEAVLLGL
jgi:serine/threonine-protein kinase